MRGHSDETAVAISVAVRYKSSPRGLASKLASATPVGFARLVREGKNGTAYEQTSNSKEALADGVCDVARVVAESAPYDVSTFSHHRKVVLAGTMLGDFAAAILPLLAHRQRSWFPCDDDV